MEKCSCSLSTEVQQNGRISSVQLRKLCEDLCSALSHIHQQGIYHRDVKPQNILMREDGGFILADFGIARFDPEFFSGTQLTERGDRLANFRFSAPEQLEREPVITAATDIFALGQVLYWSVTSETIRGSAAPMMQSIDQKYALFDDIVVRMTKQIPLERLQSAIDVSAMLRGKCIRDRESERRLRTENEVRNSLANFEDKLRRSTPGKRGVIHIDDDSKIHSLLSGIATICDQSNIWWSQGNAANQVTSMDCVGGSSWVIDSIECTVTDCWIMREARDEQCAVLVRSAAMPSFELGEAGFAGYVTAALYNGRYITADEHSGGFANIDGNVVKLDGQSELRTRYIRPNYFFIATQYSSVVIFESESTIDAFIKNLHVTDRVDIEQLVSFRNLPRRSPSDW